MLHVTYVCLYCPLNRSALTLQQSFTLLFLQTVVKERTVGAWGTLNTRSVVHVLRHVTHILLDLQSVHLYVSSVNQVSKINLCIMQFQVLFLILHVQM